MLAHQPTDLQEQFLEDGYLILDNFFSHDICDFLMAHIHSLIKGTDLTKLDTIFSTKSHQHAGEKYFLDSGDKVSLFLEEGALDDCGQLTTTPELAINKVGHGLHSKDPAFYCFSHLREWTQLMEEVGIVQPKIMQSMYIFKQPHIGGEVVPHQDSTFLYVEEKPITGFWVALEDATIENGCLWAIPGGHHTKLKSRMLRDGDSVKTETYDDTPWEMDNMIPLEVKKGTVIVLHGLLPHMSKENTSGKSRHAYAIHVMSGKDTFAKDNWLQLDN